MARNQEILLAIGAVIFAVMNIAKGLGYTYGKAEDSDFLYAAIALLAALLLFRGWRHE